MGHIILTSENGMQRAVFKSQQEMVQALVADEIGFTPIIKDQKFSDVEFKRNDSFNEYGDENYSYPIKAVFENCRFENTDFYGNLNAAFKNCQIDKMWIYGHNHVIEFSNSTINELGSEFCSMHIKGENSQFTGLSLNENRVVLLTNGCNFEDNNIYKTHISGNVKNGKFDIAGRTWLGQYDPLIMTNVDFGPEKVDEAYFYDEHYHDPLKLVNCRNAGNILNKKRNGALVLTPENTVHSLQNER